MARSLIIVESPTKIKTLKKILGSAYSIKASVGHIKDLPKDSLGVDISHDFKPKYITIRGKGSVIAEIKKAAADADKIYLAADPDREGEAISWHIANELHSKKDAIYRVLFNEITKRAVIKALQSPDRIDLKKVNAQQTRRILDRIVGYQISPLLWKKVRWGLSAGRVQSVAVRLICDREREIRSFIKEEYWTIMVNLSGENPPQFLAKLYQYKGKKISIPSGEKAHAIQSELEMSSFHVTSVKKKNQKKSPVAPFITSSLQQEASRVYRFSAKKTMFIAQKIYEGKEIGNEGSVGLVTYIRTDSPRVAQESQEETRGYIHTKFDERYVPEKPRQFKSKKGIQDAHEAIRPTSIWRDPESIKSYLEDDEYKLYKLIWQRFLASQMADALFDVTTIEIRAQDYLFRASGSVMKFDGFLKIYQEKIEEKNSDKEVSDKDQKLPLLQEGERLTLNSIKPQQHFTQPPPYYTEARLIKELEDKGIGRPSTYATILSTIINREYIEKDGKNLRPTELGCLITDLLTENFPEILNIQFTASMEDKLDQIEEGRADWIKTLHEFYRPFNHNLESAQQNMRNIKQHAVITDVACDKCGQPMAIKWGKNGEFLSCSAYPACKNTKEFERTEEGRIKIKEPATSDQTCTKCGSPMLVKHGRYGSFLGCSAYPKCTNIISLNKDNNQKGNAKDTEAEVTDKKCQKCGSPMVVKNGRYGRFLSCSKYPECKSIMPLSLGIPCPVPDCSGELVEKKTKKGKSFYGCGNYPKCQFALWQRPVGEKCPQCGFPFLIEGRGEKAPLRCGNKECDYTVEKAALVNVSS
ncbi:MAG: type I DNA topoisomerase [bacterium]